MFSENRKGIDLHDVKHMQSWQSHVQDLAHVQ